MSKKEIEDLKKLKEGLKDSDKNMDSLIKMVEDPEKYFEEHPIEEDWSDPPEFPTLKEYESAFEDSCPIVEQIKMYAKISGINHFQKRVTKEHELFEVVTNHTRRNELEELIAVKLRKVGYEVRTQSNVGKWDSYDSSKDLHFGIGEGLCISEMPRIKGRNLEITEFISDENGNIRNYNEMVKAYQESNAPKPNGLDELTKDLNDKQKKMVEEFLVSEELKPEDISSIEQSSYESDILEIDTFSRRYSIVESEQIAERIAFQMIDDDSEMEYFWKEKVKADNYKGGLQDFIKAVKNDGWHYQLCRYDHNYEETKSGFIYWRED